MGAENFAAKERALQNLERECEERTQRVRDMLQKEGRPELVAEMDRALNESASGITGARSTWHSISDAQRRALFLLDAGPGDLRRVKGQSYDVVSPAGIRATGIRLATVRNLASRGLLEWTGGAFDPEASAQPTEQMAFVLKHGRPAAGTHFKGFRP